MTAPKQITPLDLILMASLVVIWGSSFAMSKIAIRDLDPNWVAGLRLAVGGLVMLAIAIAKRESPMLVKPSWPKYIWLGLIGNALPFALISWGIQYTSSGITGLLMGTIPLFVIVIAHFLLPHEKLNRPKALGFILGFIGIVVLIDPRSVTSASFSGKELAGEIAIIIACLCYGIHSVTAKRLGFDKPFQQTAGILVAGAIMGCAFAYVINPNGLNGLTAQSTLAVVGLGLLPTALATVIVYNVMERIGPSAVSFTNYLVPIFALLLGALMFHEQLSWNIAFALMFILAGVAATRLSRRRL